MTTVLISGSRNVTISAEKAQEIKFRIDKIVELGFNIIVGDASGIDTRVIRYLEKINYDKVTVYYATFGGRAKCRLTTKYQTVGIPGTYIDRDRYMCSLADFGLAVWNGKSCGTKANIDRVAKTRVILVN